MTQQWYAVVQRIKAIEPHPDPSRTRIEVIELGNGTKLVTGKHYRVGLLGIWLRPGALIPGWLAEQLWLVGKKRAGAWFEVRSIPIVGVDSPGLFCGAEYMTDGSAESAQRYAELDALGGMKIDERWIAWPYWRAHWKEGHTLDGYLGVIPKPELVLARPFGESGFTSLPIASGMVPLPISGVAGTAIAKGYVNDVTGGSGSISSHVPSWDEHRLPGLEDTEHWVHKPDERTVPRD